MGKSQHDPICELTQNIILNINNGFKHRRQRTEIFRAAAVAKSMLKIQLVAGRVYQNRPQRGDLSLMHYLSSMPAI